MSTVAYLNRKFGPKVQHRKPWDAIPFGRKLPFSEYDQYKDSLIRIAQIQRKFHIEVSRLRAGRTHNKPVPYEMTCRLGSPALTSLRMEVKRAIPQASAVRNGVRLRMFLSSVDDERPETFHALGDVYDAFRAGVGPIEAIGFNLVTYYNRAGSNSPNTYTMYSTERIEFLG